MAKPGKQPPRRGLKQWLTRKTVILTLAGGLGGIGGCTFISTTVNLGASQNNSFNLISFTYDSSENTPAASTESPSPSIASTESALVSPSEASALREGICFGEDRTVPCDTPHNREIIGVESDCSLDTAYRYIQGNPAYDFFTPSVKTESLEGYCLLTTPERSSSVLGLWSSPPVELDSLRLCFAGHQARPSFIGCNEKHVGEVIHRQNKTDSTPLDCVSRAEEYTGKKQDSWRDILKVTPLPTEDAFYCVLESRNGKNLLTQLRQLENRKIIFD